MLPPPGGLDVFRYAETLDLDHRPLAAPVNEHSYEVGQIVGKALYGAGVNVTLVRKALKGSAPPSMMKVDTSTSAG